VTKSHAAGFERTLGVSGGAALSNQYAIYWNKEKAWLCRSRTYNCTPETTLWFPSFFSHES